MGFPYCYSFFFFEINRRNNTFGTHPEKPNYFLNKMSLPKKFMRSSNIFVKYRNEVAYLTLDHPVQEK